MVALHNSFLHFMKEKFTIEVLKEVIKERGLKYEIDDYYTAISQEHKFTDVVSDVHRNQPVHFSSDQDVLETLVLESAVLWNTDYLDPFDSRFKHIWNRDGFKFMVPAHISKTDFEDYQTKLKIMAASIAFAANSQFESKSDFETYQERARKYPGRLDFSGDKMVAMALQVLYKSKTDRYPSFIARLECYLQSEWSRKWVELFVQPLFKKVEDNIESRFDIALRSWGDSKDQLYMYYPIAVHYSKRYTSYKVSEFLIQELNEEREVEFQKKIASVVSVKPQIKSEITEIKRRHFSPYSSLDESLLYRTQGENVNDVLASNEDFEEIVRWSILKSAADFIFILEDRLATDGNLRNTDFYLSEFANLAYFLTEIDLFESPKDACHHLSCFFTGVTKSEKKIPLRWNTLRKLKDPDVIDELKKAFSKIRK